jgi:uncharacterized protein (TIGR00369 family)
MSSTVPEAWGPPREKTITWYDPMATAAAGAGMDGRTFMEAIRDGRVAPPPIAMLFGFDIAEIGDGMVTFEVTPDELAYNPIGMVHGGLVCTMLDTVTGCAVHTQLPAGTGYAHIDLQVSYLRPVHGHTGRLSARGWVTKPGRRVAFAQGEVSDPAGKLLATATASLAVMTAPAA